MGCSGRGWANGGEGRRVTTTTTTLAVDVFERTGPRGLGTWLPEFSASTSENYEVFFRGVEQGADLIGARF